MVKKKKHDRDDARASIQKWMRAAAFPEYIWTCLTMQGGKDGPLTGVIAGQLTRELFFFQSWAPSSTSVIRCAVTAASAAVPLSPGWPLAGYTADCCKTLHLANNTTTPHLKHIKPGGIKVNEAGRSPSSTSRHRGVTLCLK